jgi:integrase
MPKQPKEPPTDCQYFSWYLRRKSSGIYFADGRHNKGYDLGKPSLNTRDLADAIERLRLLDEVKAMDCGLIDQYSDEKIKNVLLEQGWDMYLAKCQQPEILDGISPESCKRYQAVRDKHLAFCRKRGHSNWSEITKKTTHDYGNWLAKKEYADNTIVLELNLICSVVKWMVEEDHLPPECRFYLKLSKPDDTTAYCYSKPEVSRMINYCLADKKLHWLAQVIIGLATSGMRINELAGLRWTDVDLQANTIRLSDERFRSRKKKTGRERRLKGRRSRAIPMHPGFRKVVKNFPRNPDGLIFRAQRGGRLRDRQVLKVLQNQVIEDLKSEFPTPPGEVGFADGTVHSLRHYFCSEAYRNGATDAELLAWLGHRDSKIMQRYRHLRKEDSHRRMEQISFFDGDDEGEENNGVANN